MTTPDAQVRDLDAIWGSSATDVFVAGNRGLMWHWAFQAVWGDDSEPRAVGALAIISVRWASMLDPQV